MVGLCSWAGRPCPSPGANANLSLVSTYMAGYVLVRSEKWNATRSY